MIITKQQILTAIKSEPILASGAFLRYFPNDPTLELETCPVCAVGSILRNAIDIVKLFENNKTLNTNMIGVQICHGLFSNDDLFHAKLAYTVDSKKYFLAYLSCFFEKECSTVYFKFLHPSQQIISAVFQDEIKSRLIKFVEENCPVEVELNCETLMKGA